MLAPTTKSAARLGAGSAQPDAGVTAALSAKVRGSSSSSGESGLIESVELPAASDSDVGAPKPRTGSVVIGTSQGWATVFDGGRRLGTTPLRARLHAGTHTLVIRPYGARAARQRNIEVSPGRTIKLRIDL